MMSQDFIIHVKVTLAKHNKSQAWLAKQLNISPAYMSDIMKGKRSPNKQIGPIEMVLNTLEDTREECGNADRSN